MLSPDLCRLVCRVTCQNGDCDYSMALRAQGCNALFERHPDIVQECCYQLSSQIAHNIRVSTCLAEVGKDTSTEKCSRQL
jgi:hypothetical protein